MFDRLRQVVPFDRRSVALYRHSFTPMRRAKFRLTKTDERMPFVLELLLAEESSANTADARS